MAKGAFNQVTGAVAAIAAVAFLYYVLVYVVPDVKQGQVNLAAEIKTLRNELKTELATHLAQEQASRERVDTSLKVMRSHIIAVTQKVQRRPLRPSELNELLTNVRDISDSEATKLSEHSTVTGPDVPEVPALVTAMLIKGTVRPDVAQSFDASMFKGRSASVRDYLAFSLLQKSGKWETTDTGIKFIYDGGSALFKAKQPFTKEDLKNQVEIFNSASRAVGLAIASDQGK
jgi:predicted XRE-type DNA-binding protein